MTAPRTLACLLAATAALMLAPGGDPTRAASGSVLVVGDSLSVGTTPYLRRELPGVSVTSDGRVGRPSGEAVSVLRGLLGSQAIVVFDAGVNDDPGQPSRLSSDLASAHRLVGSRCMVVATLSRPPYRGVSVDGLNRAVRQFAASSSNVRLVDWRSEALSNPGLINSDGVHPTASGYALRARLFAQAIAACGSSAPQPGPSSQAPGPTPGPGATPPRTTPRRRHAREPPSPLKPVKPAKPKPPPPRLGSQSPVVLDEPVSIQSRGARLAGELLAPAGGGRHPAVVMIQGSGAAAREPYREQGEFLAEHGVAALIYDKRGAGESTGDPGYRFAQLADDARAAVAMLRARPEVRPDGVGVWGYGEGGTIAPLVAAGNPAVAAVMVVSASAVAPARQQAWAVRRSLRTAGAGAGTGVVARYYAVASDLGGDLSFDPGPAWRRVSQPVLAVWGTNDPLVPAHGSAAALAGALAGGGVNHDRTFRTFTGADHGIGIASESYRPGSAPGFKELSAAWLRTHLGSPRARATVATPLPPADSAPVLAVQRASALEHWPVQLGWLALPALALLLLGARARRRRDGEDPRPRRRWLAGVVALDLLSLCALAFAVASIIEVDGKGVESVAGMPALVALTWAVALAGLVATALLARMTWRTREAPAAGVCLASVAWLALVAYWLV